MSAPFVIATYNAQNGAIVRLREVLATHTPLLRSKGLAADTPAILLENGTAEYLIEIFQWKSIEAMRSAHADAEVAELWNEMRRLCSFVAFADMPEAVQKFPEFKLIAIV